MWRGHIFAKKFLNPKNLTVFVLALAAIYVFPWESQAQTCITYDHIKKVLKDRFKEEPYLRGLSRPGDTMVIFKNDKNEYSVIMVRPNKCIYPVSEGKHLDYIKKEEDRGH